MLLEWKLVHRIGVWLGQVLFILPFALFLKLIFWVGACLDHLEPLSIGVLLFVVDLCALSFTKTSQQGVNFLFLDYRVYDPLWHLPILDQPVVDFVLGQVSFLRFVLLDQLDPFGPVFSRIPCLVHALEELKFLVVSGDHFIELLIIVHLLCRFLIVLLVVCLLQ